jgi:hypothetical protein
MATLRPDPTFYPSPRQAMKAPPEELAYVVILNPDGNGPGGVFVMDHDTFEPLGRWEMDRGPQQFAYDFWWHLGYDTMVTSSWGTPNMVEAGLDPEILLCPAATGTTCTCGICAAGGTCRHWTSARSTR